MPVSAASLLGSTPFSLSTSSRGRAAPKGLALGFLGCAAAPFSGDWAAAGPLDSTGTVRGASLRRGRSAGGGGELLALVLAGSTGARRTQRFSASAALRGASAKP